MGAADVLQDAQATPGRQHASRLAQGDIGFADGAEHQGADDPIEARVIEGKRLGFDDDEPDSRGPARRQRERSRIGIDRGDQGGWRVVRELSPGSHP